MNSSKRIELLISLAFVVVLLLMFPNGCISLKAQNDTLQSEIEDALERGLDGIIVYVDQGGDTAQFAAGWKNRENKVPADPQACSRLQVSASCTLPQLQAKLVHDDSLSLGKNSRRIFTRTRWEN
jgi:lysozyme family protein